jgi:hypothetical protein
MQMRNNNNNNNNNLRPRLEMMNFKKQRRRGKLRCGGEEEGRG